MRRRWKDKVLNSRATLPVAIALGLCGWSATHALFSEMESGAWILLLVYAIVSYLLFEFNTNFTFIRAKSPIQVCFFLLVALSFPEVSTAYSQFSTVSLLIAIYFLFNSYQDKYTVYNVHNSFIFLSVSSLLQPYYAWLIPLFWYGCDQLLTLHRRSLAASILGFLLPYWALWGYCYIQDSLPVFYTRVSAIFTIQPIAFSLSVAQLIGFVALLLLFLIATIYFYTQQHSAKFRTRNYLNFLIILGWLLATIILLQQGLFCQLLPMLIATISLVVSQYLSVTHGRWVNFLFILVCISILSVYLINNLAII